LNSFTKLHFELIGTTDRLKRRGLLLSYFETVSEERDRHWARLLLGGAGKLRLIDFDELRSCASSFTGFPLWLIEESIRHTGNVTEAISLIVKSHTANSTVPLHAVMDRIHTSSTLSYRDKEEFIHSVWKKLPEQSVYLFNRLITAGYRSPLSDKEYKQLSGSTLIPPRSHHTIDAVLLYASRNEYTFAVWKDDLLIPIVKISHGIPPDDHLYIRRFIDQNTRERFGPVHSINPELVCEIGFEGVERAPRRKSGVKLLFPLIIRRRENIKLENIDRIEALSSLLDET
jgi:hypothetical protein